MATEVVETLSYRANGITDEVTKCQVCGKPELKGTVHMLIVDSGNWVVEELYAGVTCAAKLAGRKAAEIRAEAKRADRERKEAMRAAYEAWQVEHTRWYNSLRQRTIGFDVPPRVVREWHDSPEFRAAEAAFLADHPKPPYPC